MKAPCLPYRLLLATRRDPRALRQIARACGDVVRLPLGPYQIVLLNDPAAIEAVLVRQHRNVLKGSAHQHARRWLGDGLLVSEGKHHLRLRRLMQPAFQQHRLARDGGRIVAEVGQLTSSWQPGQVVEITQAMMRLSLLLVGQLLLSTDLTPHVALLHEALDEIGVMLMERRWPWSPLLALRPSARARQRTLLRQRLDSFLDGLIAQRAARDPGDDLLGILLGAVGQSPISTHADVRDQLLTMLLAGRETTASALTWSWYLLARAPEVEARFHEEVDRVVGAAPATADHLPDLPYTRMIFAEALRLYPPAWGMSRRVQESCVVAGSSLPAGSLLLMSQYVTHHDPRFYPDPFRFEPLRWHPDAVAARPKGSYFPFGAGPRQCIGQSLAWMEGVLTLVTIAQRWRLRLVRAQLVELAPRASLQPLHGIPMRVEPR